MNVKNKIFHRAAIVAAMMTVTSTGVVPIHPFQAIEAQAAKICTVKYIRGVSSPQRKRRKAIREARRAWRDNARNEAGGKYRLIHAVKARPTPKCITKNGRYTCIISAQACRINQSTASNSNLEGECAKAIWSFDRANALGCSRYKAR